MTFYSSGISFSEDYLASAACSAVLMKFCTLVGYADRGGGGVEREKKTGENQFGLWCKVHCSESLKIAAAAAAPPPTPPPPPLNIKSCILYESRQALFFLGRLLNRKRVQTPSLCRRSDLMSVFLLLCSVTEAFFSPPLSTPPPFSTPPLRRRDGSVAFQLLAWLEK